ncbi:MAG: hypothetical protein F6J89_06345 [Symploca sp. SIO1C4]|uniref:Uncharacterized protein n=1 Tax=Symploca sp. SIO1C4 TaxID=2607765 RepID=A0A6B3N6Q2_9CYAN|nr:hypothetical protein [Symploca sp. SIO1C4]
MRCSIAWSNLGGGNLLATRLIRLENDQVSRRKTKLFTSQWGRNNLRQVSSLTGGVGIT